MSEDGRDIAVWLLVVALGLALWNEVPMPLAVGLFVLAVVLAAWSPAGATAAVMTAVPFVYHPLPIGTREFSPLEITILAGCGGVGIRGLIDMLRGRSRSVLHRLLTPMPMTLAAGALAVVGIASLFFVADPDHLTESLRELRTTIVEPIGAFLLVRWTVRSGRLAVILIALCGTGAIVAVHGIEQFLTRSGGVVGNQTYRARGPYPHPNNLALYLERVVALAAGLALMRRAQTRYILPVLAVLAIGLALTYSRGALLGLAAGGAVLVAFRRPHRGWLVHGVAVAAAIAAFATVAGGRLLATGTEGAESTRELIWRASARMVADHPVMGVGLDQFLYQYSRRYVDPAGWPERYTSHPHNLFLDVWLRLGLPGLVVFAVLAILTVRFVRAARMRDDLGGAAAAGAAAALVAGLAHGLVDNGFFLPDLAVLTWCFIALVEHDANRRAPMASNEQTTPLLAKAVPA